MTDELNKSLDKLFSAQFSVDNNEYQRCEGYLPCVRVSSEVLEHAAIGKSWHKILEKLHKETGFMFEFERMGNDIPIFFLTSAKNNYTSDFQIPLILSALKGKVDSGIYEILPITFTTDDLS